MFDGCLITETPATPSKYRFEHVTLSENCVFGAGGPTIHATGGGGK